MSELGDLIVVLAVCFAPIWLMLNANRLKTASRTVRKRLWRVYATTLARWVPGPIRTRIYAYHGKRALERSNALGRARQ